MCAGDLGVAPLFEAHRRVALDARISSLIFPEKNAAPAQPSEVNHQAGADAEVILVIVGAVVKGRHEVVRLKQAHGEARRGAQIKTAPEVRGERRI